MTALDQSGAEILTSCTVLFTVKNIGHRRPVGDERSWSRGDRRQLERERRNAGACSGQSAQLQGTINLGCHNTDVVVTADTTSLIDESNKDNNVLESTVSGRDIP